MGWLSNVTNDAAEASYLEGREVGYTSGLEDGREDMYYLLLGIIEEQKDKYPSMFHTFEVLQRDIMKRVTSEGIVR